MGYFSRALASVLGGSTNNPHGLQIFVRVTNSNWGEMCGMQRTVSILNFVITGLNLGLGPFSEAPNQTWLQKFVLNSGMNRNS
jgi:hypothetical protein